MSISKRIISMAATVAATATAAAAILITQTPVAHADESCSSTQIFTVSGTTDPFGIYFPNIANQTKVVYPAMPIFRESASVGVTNLNNEVRSFHDRCPEAHITMVGYSQGAWVVTQEVTNLHMYGGIPEDQINAVVFGDPTRHDANSFGIAPHLESFGFGDIQVARWCFFGDPVCDPAAAGDAIGLFTSHLNYIHIFDRALELGGNGDYIIPVE